MRKNEKGQSLFEVVIALGMITVIVTGIIILAVNSLRNSLYARNKSQATRYVQEVVEWLREERNNGISLFLNHQGTWCVPDIPYDWSLNFVCNEDMESHKIQGTNLFRVMTLTAAGSLVEGQIVVMWQDNQGYHEIKSITTLADWRKR